MGKPLQSWKVKGVDIAAWDGKSGPSFSIRKSYKDKQTGEWKESKYFYVEDLKNLAMCLGQALAWVHRAPELSETSPAATIPLKTSTMDDDDIPF